MPKNAELYNYLQKLNSIDLRAEYRRCEAEQKIHPNDVDTVEIMETIDFVLKERN